VYSSIAEACETVIQVTARMEPGRAAAVYADYYPRYRALYPAMAPEFGALSQVVGKHLAAGEEPET